MPFPCEYTPTTQKSVLSQEKSSSSSPSLKTSNVRGIDADSFKDVAVHLEALLAKLTEEHEREVASLRLQIKRLEVELLHQSETEPPQTAVTRPRARSPRGAIGGKVKRVEVRMEEALTALDVASPLPILNDSESSAELEEEAQGRQRHREDKTWPSEATSGVQLFPSELRLSEGNALHQEDKAYSSELDRVASNASASASGSSQVEVFFPREIWLISDDMLKAVRRKSWDNLGEESLRTTQSLRRSGNLGDVLQVQEECHTTSSSFLILHPQSNKRIAWDIIGLFFVGYDCIMVPLQVFDLPEDNILLIIIGMLGAVFWTLDILFNFITGYYISGTLELRPCPIVRHYLRTWFVMDMSIVVTEWVDISIDSSDAATSSVSVLRALRVVRCLRMVRLLRLLKLVRIEMVMQELEAQIHSNSLLLFFGILKLIMGLMLINHVIACVWYWIGKSSQNGWPHTKGLEVESGIYFYLTAVHWSLTQFQATMEIHPHTVWERAYGIIVVLVALILFSSFLSSITNMMRQLQSLHQERTRRQRVLQDYLKEHGISTQLTIRVRRFMFTDLDERHELEAQQEAVSMLPKSLRMDVHDEAHGPHLSMHQFFMDLRKENSRLLRQLCHESLMESIAQEGDTIFGTGDACSQMIWIHKGILSYKLGRQKTAVATRSMSKLKTQISLTDRDWEQTYNVRADGADELHKDRWLSEPVLWTQWEHAGECRALVNTSILIMDALIFCKTVRRYEAAHASAALYARRYVEELNKALLPSDLQLPPEDSDLDALLRAAFRRAKTGEQSMDVESVTSRISVRSVHTGLS